MVSDQGKKAFKPPIWLRNNHLQTIFRKLFYKPKRFSRTHLYELSLEDGDFIDFVWEGDREAPLIILLHGLEGSFYSESLRIFFDALVGGNFQIICMQYRTCSTRMNLLPEYYHASEGKDLKYLVDWLSEQVDVPLFACGLSLGGNVLLHYLADNVDNPLSAAMCVSCPYEMSISVDLLPAFYQNHFLKSMKKKISHKINSGHQMPVALDQLKTIKSLREFDRMVTAPVYGFASEKDYYDHTSSRSKLHKIRTPVLTINALDDPFVPMSTLPGQSEIPECMVAERYQYGGHLGFVSGVNRQDVDSWLGERAQSFFQKFIDSNESDPSS